MRAREHWAWVLIVAVVAACQPTADLPPALGDRLPDSRLEVVHPAETGRAVGETLALSDLEGKPIVLDFWASWCSNCRRQHQQVTELKEKYGDRIEVVGVLFNDSPEAGLRWLEEHGATYGTVMEESNVLAEEFWLSGLPYFALLTPDRRLSWDYLGLSAVGIPDSVTVRLDRMLGL